jgi:uncharacterized protein (TIGR00661 family)
MAKILYGVAGEGSGHSTRSKVIIEHLISQGHIVKVVSYDRGYKNLTPFFDVTEVVGLQFVFKDNKIKPLPTLMENVKKTSRGIRSMNKIGRIVDEFLPDIVFTDFEPMTVIGANTRKIPLISIDNQHFITGAKINYPRKYAGEANLAKFVIRSLVPYAKAYLSFTFVEEPVTNSKTFLFPPVLRNEVLAATPREGDFILVYLTSQFKGLVDILSHIRKRFVVYGFQKDSQEGNLTFRKASQDGFLRDLADCQGVVANAGFSLISEALYLGKPYLAVPVAGQFEQVLNAYYLEKLGYGKYWDELNQERVEAFLFNLDHYKEQVGQYDRQDNTKIFTKIDELIKTYS